MKAVICENCHEEFKGRSNKKFCSTSCKNQFHNHRNKEKNALFNELNKQLQRNYSVLNQTFDIYRSSPVKLEILEKQGLQPISIPITLTLQTDLGIPWCTI